MVEQKKVFKVNVGISNTQIDQLIEYTNGDKLIRTYTTDTGRFRDRKVFEKWSRKERTIYTLTDEKGDLFGIIWYGEEEIPKNKKYTEEFNNLDFGITFAIRLYGRVRGKGLAKWFMTSASKIFKRSKDYQEIKSKGLWLETYAHNVRAIRTYKNFGYKQVSSLDEQNRIIMLLEHEVK